MASHNSAPSQSVSASELDKGVPLLKSVAIALIAIIVKLSPGARKQS